MFIKTGKTAKLHEVQILKDTGLLVSFMWDADKMPDPMGGKRLLDYDCKVKFKKSHIIEPRKIEKPDDIRPGTKKGKLDQASPIWIVEIQMPKKLNCRYLYWLY